MDFDDNLILAWLFGRARRKPIKNAVVEAPTIADDSVGGKPLSEDMVRRDGIYNAVSRIISELYGIRYNDEDRRRVRSVVESLWDEYEGDEEAVVEMAKVKVSGSFYQNWKGQSR